MDQDLRKRNECDRTFLNPGNLRPHNQSIHCTFKCNCTNITCTVANHIRDRNARKHITAAHTRLEEEYSNTF